VVVPESRQGSDKALIRRILALYRHARVTGAATGSEKSYKFSGVKLNLLINFDNGPDSDHSTTPSGYLDPKQRLLSYMLLWYALIESCGRIAKILLENGADVDALTRNYGNTALWHATNKNWHLYVLLLL
jgi:hypothetical protein